MEPAVRASCHVLEFSVSPGGARQGDLHGALTIERLRTSFERRYDAEHLAYLVLWYGAILHLWTVQAGVLTTRTDLHPLLRTGDPALDRAAAALLAGGRRGPLRDLFNRAHRDSDDTLSSLRIFAQARQSYPHDPAAALAALDTGALPPPPPTPATFELDWTALAAAAPPLAGPLLRAGETTSVTWPDDRPPPYDSYLHQVDGVHLGLIDLEGGDEEFDEP